MCKGEKNHSFSPPFICLSIFSPPFACGKENEVISQWEGGISRGKYLSSSTLISCCALNICWQHELKHPAYVWKGSCNQQGTVLVATNGWLDDSCLLSSRFLSFLVLQISHSYSFLNSKSNSLPCKQATKFTSRVDVGQRLKGSVQGSSRLWIPRGSKLLSKLKGEYLLVYSRPLHSSISKTRHCFKKECMTLSETELNTTEKLT